MEPKLTLTAGAAIRRIRESAGESLEQMAEMLEMTAGQLERIESKGAAFNNGLLDDVKKHYGWDVKLLVALSYLHRWETTPELNSRPVFSLTHHRMLLGLDLS